MTEWIFSSSVLIVCIVSLRRLLRGRITQGVQYALWGLVLLRLLLPIQLGSSAMSIHNVTPAPEVSVVTAPVSGTAVTLIPPLELISPPVDPTPKVPPWQSMVWVTGSAIIGAWFAYTNLSFRRKLKRHRVLRPCQGCNLPVYVVEGLETPCLFGSAIYVTSATAHNPQQLAHVLAHEQTHHRHGDHIWSLLRCVCLVIHWYNPLVWWAAVLSSRDCELACDEATMASFATTERMVYGRTLLEMTCAQTPSLLMTASTMVGGKQTLKERIVRIAHKPNMARYTVVGLGLVVVCVVGITFTGAKAEAVALPKEPPTTEAEPAQQETPLPESKTELLALWYASSLEQASILLGSNPQESIDHLGIQVSPQDYFTIAPCEQGYEMRFNTSQTWTVTQEELTQYLEDSYFKEDLMVYLGEMKPSVSPEVPEEAISPTEDTTLVDETPPTVPTVDEPTDPVRGQVEAQYQSDATVLYTDPGQMAKYVERQMAVYDQNLASRIPSSDSLSNQLYHGSGATMDYWLTAYAQESSTLGALWMQSTTEQTLPFTACLQLGAFDAQGRLLGLSPKIMNHQSMPLMLSTLSYPTETAYVELAMYDGSNGATQTIVLKEGFTVDNTSAFNTYNGKSYGRLYSIWAEVVDEFIAVVGTNGNSGYIESKHILPSATPGQTLPVYNVEGMVVDTFAIAPILVENVAETSWNTIESELRGSV